MDVQLHPMDHIQVTLPNYFFVLNFEKNFVYAENQAWMKDHFPNLFYYCAIYVLLIFGGRRYMSNKPKFELKGLLVSWNIVLALLSIISFSRALPALHHVLKASWYHSICIPRHLTHNPISGFWSWIFTILKLLEFGDTAFIVLRKQPLIFLHWYHHVTVLLFTWLSYVENTGYSLWFGTVNSFIHSCMYSYYALKAMRFSLPKWISMMLTMLQIMQMFWGIFIIVSAYYYVQIVQVQCSVTTLNVKLSALMYLSYLILFVKFFRQSYLGNKNVNKIGKKIQIKTE